MRKLALVLLVVAAPAPAQTLAPSATPTNGTVGSAALNNGYPGAGGAVALPRILNSSPAATTPPLAGTTTSASTATTTTPGSSTGAIGAGSTASGSGSGQSGAGGGGGSGGAGAAARGGGSTNTAGAATATAANGGGSNWVLCPPSGAPGIEPLFAGTDLSCAPH